MNSVVNMENSAGEVDWTRWLKSQLPPFNYALNPMSIRLAISWWLTISIADKLGSSHTFIHTFLWWATIRLASPVESQYLLQFMKPLLYVLFCHFFYVVTRPRKGTYADGRAEDTKVHVPYEAEARGMHDEILEPLLFPSHTTHRRLIPKPHSFGYSYLLAGLPIYGHDTNVNNLLSSHGSHPRTSKAWFSVHSSDYLQRGSSFTGLSLRSKLDIFLANEGVSTNAFPYAYLVTAPRFLGWSFNPVSFWYLYNSDKVLSAMILEVNNTFDERRMYLLQADPSRDTTQDSKTKNFTAKWKKDFHVSPFNNRTGAYSVSVVDLAATRTVDVTIVLGDMDDKPKIVARIYSKDSSISGRSDSAVGPGIDPATMSRSARLSFLLQHGWKGFFTNPRILRQAWTLWRKNLTVFFRPEPLLNTIGRNETSEEIVIERFFRRVLQLLAEESGQDVNYTPAAGHDRGKLVHAAGKSALVKGEYAEQKAKTLHLNVLSSQFYYELAIADRTMLAVFERSCFRDSESEVLVSTSDSEALRKLFSANISGKFAGGICRSKSVTLQRSMVLFLRTMKQAGFAQACRMLLRSSTSSEISDGFSELDDMVSYIVQGTSTQSLDQNEYSHAVFSVLCADRFAFGSLTLLGLLQGLCRLIVTIFLTGVMVKVYSVAATQR